MLLGFYIKQLNLNKTQNSGITEIFRKSYRKRVEVK